MKYPKIRSPRIVLRDNEKFLDHSSGMAKELAVKIYKQTLLVNVTEKLDGENIKVGYKYDKEGNWNPYIGQRNSETHKLNKHAHWNKFNSNCGNQINRVVSILYGCRKFKDVSRHRWKPWDSSNTFGILDEMDIVDIAIFGELVGNSMQRRFRWDHNGLDIVFYDCIVVLKNTENSDLPEEIRIFLGIGGLKKFLSAPDNSGVTLRLAPELLSNVTLKEALELDPETLECSTPISYQDGSKIGEGFVISRTNITNRPVYIKVKSNRFSEDMTGRKQKKPSIPSTCDELLFVTNERIHHAVQYVAEKLEVDTEDVMIKENLGMYLRHIVSRVLNDIEEEELETPMEKSSKKIVGRETVRIFKHMVLGI